MSFWGRLFGSDDIVEKTADGIYNGIDKIFFTDEEKADASKLGFQLWIKAQEATQGQNIARRFIALLVTVFFLLNCLIYVIALYLDNSHAGQHFDFISKVLVWPFTAIITFYFFKRYSVSEKGK